MSVEIAPGYEWSVDYQFEGHEPETMIVSAISIEGALREARYSLDLAGTPYNVSGARKEES